ncbi:MAG: stage II sporulation protein D [Oscillospiraceae bacterium]|nr:stage II sporulation protein D [Oscillospiraceae bacterium]
MKSIWKEIRTAILLGALIPAFLLWFGTVLLEIQEESAVKESTVSAVQEPQAAQYFVPVREGGSVEIRELDDYLVGVVLAEMPASFETEALKAQAVVARTYTMRAYFTGGKHGDGSVCTDYSCCQAYISPDTYLEQGGSTEGVEKIKAAVMGTAGQVLIYENRLIEATYFSCSGGRTEDALAVWGTDYPYLQATESPGEEHAAHYSDTVCFTPEQFQQALGVSLKGSPVGWFGKVTYTDGGGVDTMQIGDTTYKGTELRELLSLRSTAFTVTAGEEITITTRGYGHRVGMSQYGADAMALAGNNYADILAHYYRGTVLTTLESVGN